MRERAASVPRILLGVAVGVFLLERALVLAAPLGWLDSDDAVVGVMAADAVAERGRVPYPWRPGDPELVPGWPLYFYGQPYHGSGTALLTAGLARIAGATYPGPVFLLAATSLLALAWLGLHHTVVRRHMGAEVASIATLLCALGPPYLLERSIRPAGNYVEVLLLGTAFLWACGRPFATGALGGLALWSNPLGGFAAPAAAWDAISRPDRLRRIAIGTGGFAIAAIPVWIGSVGSRGAPLRWLVGRAGPQPSKIPSVLDGLRDTITEHLPWVIGARGWIAGYESLPAIGWVVLALAYGAGVIALVAVALRSSHPDRDDARPGGAQPILLARALVGIVVLTLAVAVLTRMRALHEEPRYYVPLYLALPVGLAIAIARLPRRVGLALLASVLGLHAWTHAAKLGWRLDRDIRSRDQIDALVATGISTYAGDYWQSLHLTYGSEERLVVANVRGDAGNRYPRHHRLYREAAPCLGRLVRRDSREARAIFRALDRKAFTHFELVHQAFIPTRATCEGREVGQPERKKRKRDRRRKERGRAP